VKFSSGGLLCGRGGWGLGSWGVGGGLAFGGLVGGGLFPLNQEFLYGGTIVVFPMVSLSLPEPVAVQQIGRGILANAHCISKASLNSSELISYATCPGYFRRLTRVFHCPFSLL